MAKVQYVAKNDAHEHVYVGKEAGYGRRCARLARYGRAVTTFVMTSSQERTLKRGGKINITSKAMGLAQVWNCTKSDGGLAGRRRR